MGLGISLNCEVNVCEVLEVNIIPFVLKASYWPQVL